MVPFLLMVLPKPVPDASQKPYARRQICLERICVEGPRKICEERGGKNKSGVQAAQISEGEQRQQEGR